MVCGKNGENKSDVIFHQKGFLLVLAETRKLVIKDHLNPAL